MPKLDFNLPWPYSEPMAMAKEKQRLCDEISAERRKLQAIKMEQQFVDWDTSQQIMHLLEVNGELQRRIRILEEQLHDLAVNIKHMQDSIEHPRT